MRSLVVMIKPASSLCNIRCKYCFYADEASMRSVRSYGMMKTDTLEIVIRRIFEYASGTVSIIFQGGEPTLAGLDFYRSTIDFISQYNIHHIPCELSIQTNGLLLDEDWCRFFKENHFLVGLSLDGFPALHDSARLDSEGKGTFFRAAKALELLERFNVEYSVLCVVTNRTAQNARKLFQFLRKNGWRHVQFIPCLDPLDGYSRDWSLTEEAYGHFLCELFDCYYEAAYSEKPVDIRFFTNIILMLKGQPPESCGMSGVCVCAPTIEADGSVYPCDFYALDEYRLGSVSDNTIEEMITSDTAINFVNASVYIHADCIDCPYYTLCRGGCRRERLPDGKNRLCKAFRLFYSQKMPQLIKMSADF